jgi:hypothetical protein
VLEHGAPQVGAVTQHLSALLPGGSRRSAVQVQPLSPAVVGQLVKGQQVTDDLAC